MHSDVGEVILTTENTIMLMVSCKHTHHTALLTVSNKEVTLKRLISMLRIAQKLHVGAYSGLSEMYKLFIQQCGQRYPSP